MKLNMILGVIFIFLSLTLSACSQDQKKYNFYGASNNWVVKYETEISEGREWAYFSFEYIGEEATPAIFGYNLKSKWFDLADNEEQFNHPNKNITSGNSECTGPPLNKQSCNVIIEKNETMEATIEWNGKSEVIVLNKK